MKRVAKNQLIATIQLLKDQKKELIELEELLRDAMKIPAVNLLRLSIAKTSIGSAITELIELAKIVGCISVDEPEVKPEQIKHFAVAEGKIDFKIERVHSPEYIEVMNFIQHCYLNDVVPAGKLRGVVDSNVAGFYNNIREQLGIVPGAVICFLDAGAGAVEVLSPENEKSIVVVGLSIVDIYLALCNIPMDENLITSNE